MLAPDAMRQREENGMIRETSGDILKIIVSYESQRNNQDVLHIAIQTLILSINVETK